MCLAQTLNRINSCTLVTLVFTSSLTFCDSGPDFDKGTHTVLKTLVVPKNFRPYEIQVVTAEQAAYWSNAWKAEAINPGLQKVLVWKTRADKASGKADAKESTPSTATS